MAADKRSIAEMKLTGNKSGRPIARVQDDPDEGDRLPATPPRGLGKVGKETWVLIRENGWWLRQLHTLQVVDACEHAEYLHELRVTMRARQKLAKPLEGGGVEFRPKTGNVPKEFPAHAAYVRAKWEWRQILHELGLTVGAQIKHNLAEKVGAGVDPKDEENEYFE